MMAEGFDLPVGEGCRECGRKGCSSTSAARLYPRFPIYITRIQESIASN